MNPRPHTHASRPWRGAFTLTELLVVIAIIAALVGITIPVVSGFRNSAHQASCSSNMRQMASAVLAYASEHNQSLPTRKNASGRSMGLQYVIRDPYAHEKSAGKTATSDAQKDYYLSFLLESYTGKGDIWQCGANKAGWNASPSGVTYLANNQSGSDPPYLFGRLIGGGTTSGDPETRPKRMNQLDDPGRIWMISDADMHNYPSAGYLANKVQPPHKGKRNYVFFDGHVETRGMENLPLYGNMGFPEP